METDQSLKLPVRLVISKISQLGGLLTLSQPGFVKRPLSSSAQHYSFGALADLTN